MKTVILSFFVMIEQYTNNEWVLIELNECESYAQLYSGTMQEYINNRIAELKITGLQLSILEGCFLRHERTQLLLN